MEQDEVALLVTHDQELNMIPLEEPPVSLAQDFLNRMAGRGAHIAHTDIYKASEATVMLDEQARVIVRNRESRHIADMK
ncbi:hypothetical protein [Paenibacillus sp. JCM 10914]|uniref:hypothetical protein n=1 Tax=Paenibacillus sp. JCM 10914 TaxID=1236974 RepID=UPI001E3D0A96|nr:hypothetical protein [Paenibacillus sp. JCM 10914]